MRWRMNTGFREMSGRTFPIEHIGNHDGVTMMGAKIECCVCGAVDYSATKRGINPIVYEKNFRSKGWFIGNGPRMDKCPNCQKPKKPDLKVVNNMETAKVEAPREMTREDRRIISAKLEDVYLKDRYDAPWTDAAVARDLGVPRAWVIDVRDQFFGPAGSNDEFDDFLERAAPVISDLKNLNKSVQAQLDQAKAIASRVEEIERIGRRIEKEIGR
jgi:hypothetical protein